MGGFLNFEPLRDRICQLCNEAIGNEVELEFARNSPEAAVRSLNWVRGQKRSGKKRAPKRSVYEPTRISGNHMYLLAPDPDSGHTILWQTDEQPGTVKPISQFLIFDGEDKLLNRIPLPTSVATGRDLFSLFRAHGVASQILKMFVIAAPGDEGRVTRMLSEWQAMSPFRMDALEKRTPGRVPGPQIITGRVGPEYLRALAKIGFHYALKYIPTIIGNEGAFRALREFIRHGTGDAEQFLTPCETISTQDGPPGHILTAIAPPNADIIVNMQFFIGCDVPLSQWRLNLGRNPTVLYTETQMSAHYFTYAEADGHQLAGGKVIQMTPDFATAQAG